jgi:hypothetical protein
VMKMEDQPCRASGLLEQGREVDAGQCIFSGLGVC